MSNKKLVIGVATGVALIAAAGLLLAKRNKSAKCKMKDEASDLADSYRGKLNSLQRRAKKEFNDVMSHGEDVSGRVGDIVKKVSSNFQ